MPRSRGLGSREEVLGSERRGRNPKGSNVVMVTVGVPFASGAYVGRREKPPFTTSSVSKRRCQGGDIVPSDMYSVVDPVIRS